MRSPSHPSRTKERKRKRRSNENEGQWNNKTFQFSIHGVIERAEKKVEKEKLDELCGA